MKGKKVNQPTVVSQLTATGTGECRDKHGNLLDSDGKPVDEQKEDKS